jgi:hypothetical protein
LLADLAASVQRSAEPRAVAYVFGGAGSEDTMALAPVGVQTIVHPEGELAVARPRPRWGWPWRCAFR